MFRVGSCGQSVGPELGASFAIRNVFCVQNGKWEIICNSNPACLGFILKMDEPSTRFASQVSCFHFFA